MLGWIRQAVGVEAAPVAAPQKRVNPAIQRKLDASATSQESQEVRLQRMVRKQELDIGGLREEIDELNQEALALVKQSAGPDVPLLVRKQHEAEAKANHDRDSHKLVF